MHWWQWVLQITGAWFYLAVVTAFIWICIVRYLKRPQRNIDSPDDSAILSLRRKQRDFQLFVCRLKHWSKMRSWLSSFTNCIGLHPK